MGNWLCHNNWISRKGKDKSKQQAASHRSASIVASLGKTL